MISVKWYNTCYMCRSPLDYAVAIDKNDLLKFYTYSNFKPKNFIFNTSYLKIIGLKQRRLCLSCFCTKYNKELPGPRQLMNRETGCRKPLIKNYDTTMSVQEVYNWFEGFNEFRFRKDIDELVNENYRYATPGLTLVVWPGLS